MAGCAIAKKNSRAKIGWELINQGASTNLVSDTTAPLSGQFRKFARICPESAIDKKNSRAKIGRELINQGASTNLVSGSTAPLSGQFGKFARICCESAIAQKKPGLHWSGVN